MRCPKCNKPKADDVYKWCDICRANKRVRNKIEYQNNRETILARNAEWRKNNPVKLKAQRDRWRNENRERHRENSRKWIANNPERYREIQRHAQVRRRFLLAGQVDHYTEVEWLGLLHEYDCKCAKCGSAQKIEVDHVVPLVSGGANTIDNIQPLCRSCNAQKWTGEGDWRIG